MMMMTIDHKDNEDNDDDNDDNNNENTDDNDDHDHDGNDNSDNGDDDDDDDDDGNDENNDALVMANTGSDVNSAVPTVRRSYVSSPNRKPNFLHKTQKEVFRLTAPLVLYNFTFL